MSIDPAPETVDAAASRRESVLRAAHDAMTSARRARQRRRGALAGAAMIVLVTVAVWWTPPGRVDVPPARIDFSFVTYAVRPVDYQVVRDAPAVPCERIADAELARALRDAGECATVVHERVAAAASDRVWVLECDTGRSIVEPFWADARADLPPDLPPDLPSDLPPVN